VDVVHVCAHHPEESDEADDGCDDEYSDLGLAGGPHEPLDRFATRPGGFELASCRIPSPIHDGCQSASSRILCASACIRASFCGVEGDASHGDREGYGSSVALIAFQRYLPPPWNACAPSPTACRTGVAGAPTTSAAPSTSSRPT